MLNIAAVKEYLRLDSDAEDKYLKILILLSTELCKNYLRLEVLPKSESVKQAQLLVIGYFFENREGQSLSGGTRDGVPAAVFALLDPYRKAAF